MYKTRIWDLPTRLFHWALALCVIGLVVTGKVGGNAMVWHFRLGHVVLALIVFRILWGLVGGRWSRFANFVHRPSTILAYLKGQGKPEHSVGHNPLGALSVLGLLTVGLVQAFSGLMSDDEIAFTGPLTSLVPSSWVSAATSWHKTYGQYILLGLVGLHILAIVFYRIKKGVNLVTPMLTGDKLLPAPIESSKDSAATRTLALALALLCALGAVYIYRLAS